MASRARTSRRSSADHHPTTQRRNAPQQEATPRHLLATLPLRRGGSITALPHPLAQRVGRLLHHHGVFVPLTNTWPVQSSTLDPTLPAVFVGHVTVAGVTTPSERELTYDDDIRLGTSDLPLAPNLAYVALGHIHQRQPLPHPIPCYYSGSIDRYNMGERDDAKGMVLVDVPRSGPAVVTPLPLEATPFHEIHIPAAELDTLPDRYPDLDRAFVRVYLDCMAGADPVALRRRARDLCVRCLDVRFSGLGVGPRSGAASMPRDYRTTALDYLRQRYADDPDLATLEEQANDLVDHVLAEESSDALAAY